MISVHANQQGVALIARRFEIGHMAEVKDIKAAVCDHEAFACLANGCAPGGKFVPRDKFLTKIHL